MKKLETLEQFKKLKKTLEQAETQICNMLDNDEAFKQYTDEENDMRDMLMSLYEKIGEINFIDLEKIRFTIAKKLF